MKLVHHYVSFGDKEVAYYGRYQLSQINVSHLLEQSHESISIAFSIHNGPL